MRSLSLNHLVAGLALATTLTIGASAQSSPVVCGDVFTDAKPANVKMYPDGVSKTEMPDGFMQIAYESEYLFAESAAILRDYRPSSKVMKAAAWRALTDEQRVAWLKEKFQDKPEHAKGAGLFKVVKIDFMPKELLIDATGNVELVLPPFNTYAEWNSMVDQIVSRYGAGSQQAMVSKPRESAFRVRFEATAEQLHERNLGWLVFTNLRDTFKKLEFGAGRYQINQTKLTAQSFDHPFLGPMTKLRRDVMEEYLLSNATGGMYDDYSKQFVRKRDSSFKYTGGPAYRPDIAAPGRFSWEIRNAHKDVEDLKAKVLRDLNAHAQGLQPYAPFAKVAAFDTVADFDRLNKMNQELLKTLFPSKADPRFIYAEVDDLALETFRNFALPAHDFHDLAKALASSTAEEAKLNSKIGKARLAYTKGVYETALELKLGKITTELAKARVMGLLGLWAVNSGLVEAFEIRVKAIGHEALPAPTAPADAAIAS